MRKLKEPSKVAFGTLSEEIMDHDDAEMNRTEEFWEELEKQFDIRIRVKEKTTWSIRDAIKDEVINHLENFQKQLAQGMENGMRLWSCLDIYKWESIKFIIAFDTNYTYFDENNNDHDDYLDSVGSFRWDVIHGVEKVILEGASLAKQIGSPAYDTWIEALVQLKELFFVSENYKAVDLIAQAYPRTWGDLCTWIYMKEAQKATKKRKITKKSKK